MPSAAITGVASSGMGKFLLLRLAAVKGCLPGEIEKFRFSFLEAGDEI
jgi:hypothetical protein